MLQQLLRHAGASPDAEVCGLLFGTRDRIDAVEPCENIAADPARTFEIAPKALIAAHRRPTAGGWTVRWPMRCRRCRASG